MAINPLLAAGLVGAGGAAIAQAPNILPSQYDREQRKRLRELQLREEMNALGLTDQERSVLESRLTARSQQASEAATAERNRLLAGTTGAQAGTALLQATLQDEARARAEVQAQAAVEAADVQERAREEEQLRGLEAAVGQTRVNRRAALADVAASGFESGVERSQQRKLEQLFTGSFNISEADAARLASSIKTPGDYERTTAILKELEEED